MENNTKDFSQPIIIAYIPVIHAGYLKFINKHQNVKQIYIFDNKLETDNSPEDNELSQKIDYLRKEIRALSLDQTAAALSALFPDKKISAITKEDLQNLKDNNTPLIAPQEDVTEALIESQLPDNPVTYDSIFLRWNRKSFDKQFEVHPDVTMSSDDFDKKMITLAHQEANKSSDWWRQVGGVLIKTNSETQKNEIIDTVHNTHLPSEHQPYCDGDPRNCSHKGKNLDLYTAIHVEAKLIASAAKKGVSLEDAEMYLTLFPCPVCAKLVAQSGIKKIYFDEGYGVLDGVRVLKDAGVEIVKVENIKVTK